MSKNDSAIKKRKQDAELIVKRLFGKNYANLLKREPLPQLAGRLRAMVANSARQAGIPLSVEERNKFATELMAQANAAANKAREDYIFTLTRRTQQPKWGAIAINSWLRKQKEEEIKKKLAGQSQKENQAQSTSSTTENSPVGNEVTPDVKSSEVVSTNSNLRDSTNDHS